MPCMILPAAGEPVRRLRWRAFYPGAQTMCFCNAKAIPGAPASDRGQAGDVQVARARHA